MLPGALFLIGENRKAMIRIFIAGIIRNALQAVVKNRSEVLHSSIGVLATHNFFLLIDQQQSFAVNFVGVFHVGYRKVAAGNIASKVSQHTP